jgi:hypothetical protein
MAFVNLPAEKVSRWGENLTAEKMKQCIWGWFPGSSLRSNFLNGQEQIGSGIQNLPDCAMTKTREWL